MAQGDFGGGAGGLRPCPFCGGKAVRLPMMDGFDRPGWLSRPAAGTRATRFVGCGRCCVVSFAGVTEEECAAKWNGRRG